MAQLKSIKTKYDALVIGAGLAGLVTARALSLQGKKVYVCEERPEIGGQSRPVKCPLGEVENGLKIAPATDEAREIISWLYRLVGFRSACELVQEAPLTFDSGKFQPFVGFGDQAVDSLDEVNRFAIGEYFILKPRIFEVLQRLLVTEGVVIEPQTTVTKLNFEDGKVTGAILNGAEIISANEYYLCCAPDVATRLLPDSAIPAKLRQRLMRGPLLSSVHFDILHKSPVTESRAIHILKGANEEPCIGIFHRPQMHAEGTVQHSQWVTLVSREKSDEAEIMANALKQIQRQLKRAYPQALEGKLWDRIAVRLLSHGDLKNFIGVDGLVGKIPNLKLICGQSQPDLLALGAVAQARSAVGEIELPEEVAVELEAAPSPVETQMVATGDESASTITAPEAELQA